MKTTLLLSCISLLFFSSCQKETYSPENEAYSAKYVLAAVEKSIPVVYTNTGQVNKYVNSITQTAPFTDDTLTTIRKITFYKKDLSEIERVKQDVGKSYYSVKPLDSNMEFSPKYYGIYYKFAPSEPSIFVQAKDQNEIKNGLTMRARTTEEGIYLTKFVLAFKNKSRFVGKIDENYVDPHWISELQEGDTLVTMQYTLFLKKK